jgi:putative copper export protein
MELAMSLYDWLLFLHILAATVWLGGLVILSLQATLVLRTRDSRTRGPPGQQLAASASPPQQGSTFGA